jgi:hypothetical protein
MSKILSRLAILIAAFLAAFSFLWAAGAQIANQTTNQRATQATEGAQQTGPVGPGDDGREPLEVTIRPGERAGPPPLSDLIIRSADGRLMFLYEWLTGGKAERRMVFDLDFAAAPVDRETRSLTLHTSDFGRILGKEYRYLDFTQISAEYGWRSAPQLAAISRNRGVYLPATAAEAYDPLDQTYGVLAFRPASVFGLREWWRSGVLMVE